MLQASDRRPLTLISTPEILGFPTLEEVVADVLDNPSDVTCEEGLTGRSAHFFTRSLYKNIVLSAMVPEVPSSWKRLEESTPDQVMWISFRDNVKRIPSLGLLPGHITRANLTPDKTSITEDYPDSMGNDQTFSIGTEDGAFAQAATLAIVRFLDYTGA